MKERLRVRFWRWLFLLARVPEGEMPPRWLTAVRWALTPIEMLRWWASGYAEGALMPVIRLNGALVGIHNLERLLKPGSARWFRVVRVENGWALFETRTGEEIEQQVKDWRKVDAFLQDVLKKEARKESEG